MATGKKKADTPHVAAAFMQLLDFKSGTQYTAVQLVNDFETPNCLRHPRIKDVGLIGLTIIQSPGMSVLESNNARKTIVAAVTGKQRCALVGENIAHDLHSHRYLYAAPLESINGLTNPQYTQSLADAANAEYQRLLNIEQNAPLGFADMAKTAVQDLVRRFAFCNRSYMDGILVTAPCFTRVTIIALIQHHERMDYDIKDTIGRMLAAAEAPVDGE